MNGKSLQLAERHWAALDKIAEGTGSNGREGPSWRVLIRRIAEGELTIGDSITVTLPVAQWRALQTLLDGSKEPVGKFSQPEPQKPVAGVSEPVRTPVVEVVIPGKVVAGNWSGVARTDPAPSKLAPRNYPGDLRGDGLEAARPKPISKHSQETVQAVIKTVDRGDGTKVEYTA